MAHTKTLQTRSRLSPIAWDLLLALVGGCFLAICSQIAIPLPFTPVPLTLQTFAVFLLGGLLGPRRAVYGVLCYLAQGVCGLPVFAGGVANICWILDPKAGFLLSFLAAAFLIGKMIEKRPNGGLLYLLLSLLVGQLAISTIGAIWLSAYVGPQKALLLGVLPFLSGAAIKISAGAIALRTSAD